MKSIQFLAAHSGQRRLGMEQRDLGKGEHRVRVIGKPSLSMMPMPTTGSLESTLTGCPGAI